MVQLTHKLMTAAGALIFLVSGAALDGPDWVAGFVGVFAGLSIGGIGYMLADIKRP